MKETQTNPHNGDDRRKSRIRGLVKSLKRSQLVRLRITKESGPTAGTLEWSSGREPLEAKVGLRAEPQPNGRCNLHISPWPADLRPLVAYFGVPGVCRIKELQTRFGVTQLPRDLFADDRDRAEALALSGSPLRADGYDEGDEIDSADWEPEETNCGWIDLDLSSGRIEVHAELEENANPGMIVVDIRWLDLDGEDVRNQFTMELTECDEDDIWSGRIRIKLPVQTHDGQFWVTARSLTAEDMIQLSSDETDDESSEVSRLIARSRFSLNGIQINEDRSEIIIGDVELEQLEDSNVDEWLIQATTSASETTDLEDAVREDESLPFEQRLRSYRDNQHAKPINLGSNESDEQRIWVEIYYYFVSRFPTWDEDQIVDAINLTYEQIAENGLPERTDNENLTAWVKRKIRWNLGGDHRREQRHHRKREKDFEIEKRPESSEGATATKVVVDLEVDEVIDEFIELLTPEELGYWAIRHWLDFKDVEIQNEMILSEYRVRSLADRIDRKLFVFQGLTWIKKSCATRGVISFSDHERELVMRCVFDGLDTDNAVSAVGLNLKNGRKLLREALQKVELAAAAWNVNLPEEYLSCVVRWFDPLINHGINADAELTHIGRRLHAQIMLSTLPRKKLKKASKKFIHYRIIERKGLADTFSCICSHYKSTIPSQEDLQAVPDDVVRVWNEFTSAVPECIRRVTAEWLCAH